MKAGVKSIELKPHATIPPCALTVSSGRQDNNPLQYHEFATPQASVPIVIRFLLYEIPETIERGIKSIEFSPPNYQHKCSTFTHELDDQLSSFTMQSIEGGPII